MNQTDNETVGRTEWDILYNYLPKNKKTKYIPWLIIFLLGAVWLWKQFKSSDDIQTKGGDIILGDKVMGNKTQNYNLQSSNPKNYIPKEDKKGVSNVTNKVLKGIIIGIDSKPVPFANIKIEGHGKVFNVSTNQFGDFELSIDKDIEFVRFIFTKNEKIGVQDFQLNGNNITLEFKS